jgi:hypothetical protein
MTDTIGISGDRIRSFIERIDHIDEEIKGFPLSEGHGEREHAGNEGGITQPNGIRIAAQPCLTRNVAKGRSPDLQG